MDELLRALARALNAARMNADHTVRVIALLAVLILGLTALVQARQ